MDTTDTTAPRILDLDPSDASIALCEEYAGRALDVAAFDAMMAYFAAEQAPRGGYAKIRGVFAFTDAAGEAHRLDLRIDVDRAMSEGRTLAERLERSARYYRSDRGRAFGRTYGFDAAEAAEVYAAAALAARAAREATARIAALA